MTFLSFLFINYTYVLNRSYRLTRQDARRPRLPEGSIRHQVHCDVTKDHGQRHRKGLAGELVKISRSEVKRCIVDLSGDPHLRGGHCAGAAVGKEQSQAQR